MYSVDGIYELFFNLNNGIDVGIDVGFDVGLDVGVEVDFDVGVDVGLDVGVDIGLDVGVVVDLDVGIEVGLDIGLDVGIDVSIDLIINVGIDVGIDVGLKIGFFEINDIDGFNVGILYLFCVYDVLKELEYLYEICVFECIFEVLEICVEHSECVYDICDLRLELYFFEVSIDFL